MINKLSNDIIKIIIDKLYQKIDLSVLDIQYTNCDLLNNYQDNIIILDNIVKKYNIKPIYNIFLACNYFNKYFNFKDYHDLYILNLDKQFNKNPFLYPVKTKYKETILNNIQKIDNEIKKYSNNEFNGLFELGFPINNNTYAFHFKFKYTIIEYTHILNYFNSLNLQCCHVCCFGKGIVVKNIE